LAFSPDFRAEVKPYRGFGHYAFRPDSKDPKGKRLDFRMTTPTISSALPGSPVASKPECVYAGHTPERSKADFFAFNEEYLRRLKEGEEATERHFVVYFSPLVLMKLKQRLRNREELEDLRQDVFLRVFQSLRKGPGLRRAECLGAYVHSICANVVLEYLRRRGRTVQWSEDMPEPRDRAMSIEYKLVTDEVKEEISKVLACIIQKRLMNKVTQVTKL